MPVQTWSDDPQVQAPNLTPPAPIAAQIQIPDTASSGSPPPATGMPAPPDDKYDRSGKDRFLGFINQLTGGGSPAIKQRLDDDHARKIHDLQMYQDAAKQYAGILATGIDPATGQQLTPEARQKYQNQYNTAMGAYGKIAGTSKEGKGIFQRMQQVAGHIIGGGGQAPAAAGAAAKPSGSGMPPPPQGASPGATAPPSSQLPPPPDARQAAMGAPALASQQERNQKQSELDAEEKRKFDEFKREHDYTDQMDSPEAKVKKAQAALGRELTDEEKTQLLKLEPKRDKPVRQWTLRNGKPVSVEIDPRTNKEIPGTENDDLLPPAYLTEHIRQGEATWVDADGNVHVRPTTSDTKPKFSSSSGGSSKGGTGSKSDRVIGNKGSPSFTKANEAADAAETDYELAKTRLEHPTPIGDTGIVIDWVRSQVRGAGRINNTEIEAGLKSGSYGTRFKNAYDRAVTGKLDDTFRKQMVDDIKVAADAARKQADKYKGSSKLPAPPKSADDEAAQYLATH